MTKKTVKQGESGEGGNAKGNAGEGIVCADKPHRRTVKVDRRLARVPPTALVGHSGQFQPGQSGNPHGVKALRVSARTNLTDMLVRDLTEFYQLRGKELFERVADDNPALMISIFARLLPREMHQTMTHIVADISDECRRAMAESWLVANTIDVTPEPAPAQESEPDGEGV